MRDNEKTWVMAGHWTRIITLSPKPGERSQTIYWCQKFAAQRGCVGKNTNILNNYNVTQNLKRTIIYTKLHDMPLSWKLLFGYLHIFFAKVGNETCQQLKCLVYFLRFSKGLGRWIFFVCPRIFCQRGWELFDGLWWRILYVYKNSLGLGEIWEWYGIWCDNYRETEEVML